MLSILPIITALLPGLTDILKRVIPDPVAQAEAQKQLTELLTKDQVALYEAMKGVMIADSQSADPYTSRARPTIVYWSLGIITLIVALGMFGHAEPVLEALKMIPDKLWELMTFGTGLFMVGRSVEKAVGKIRRGG